MINDIKLGFKLFPYTLNFKGLRFSLILFVIIGVGFELAGFVTYQPTLATLGAYYIVLASLYFVQGINQMEYNYLFLSSGKRKRIITRSETLVSLVCQTVALTIFAILRTLVIKFQTDPNVAQSFKLGFFAIACAVFIQSFYLSVYYRYPVLGYLLILIMIVPMEIIIIFDKNPGMFDALMNLPYWATVLTPYIALLLGSCINVILSSHLYKVPIKESLLKSSLSRATK